MPCKAKPNFNMLGFSYQSFEEGVRSFYVLIFDMKIYVGFPDVFRLIKGDADTGAIYGKLKDRFGAIKLSETCFKLSIGNPRFRVVLKDFNLTLVNFAASINLTEL